MFGKVFQQMYDGTLGTAGPWEALVTFQQMIVLADKNGDVDLTMPALSRRTTIPLPIIEKGIEALMKPDRYSRTPGEDGRRIVLLDDHRPWGWRIVNYIKYRDIKSEQERRDYHRSYYHSVRKLKNVENVEIQQPSTLSNHTDTDTEVEAKVEAKTKKPPAAPWLTADDLIADGLSATTAVDFIEHRRAKRAKLTRAAWEGFKREVLKAPGWTNETAALKAVARNWTAFEAAWVAEAGAKVYGAAQESFRERDDRLAAERVYEFTGGHLGRAPAAPSTPTQEIFDVTPRRLDR